METILNIVLASVIIFVVVTWIVSLVKWDGKYPCSPADCEDCPYSGVGCDIDPTTKKTMVCK